ncbi:MAG: radical SAM protein [Myxococcota bacterium]|nr:radical SAM protein [Myxococcota bacterium]
MLAPPVCTPAEPPSGAFMLACGLAGRGYDTGFLDLSLAFFHRALDGEKTRAALDYLHGATDGYEPMRHRSATGLLHKQLQRFEQAHPGWKLTLMDLQTPSRLHDPRGLARLLQEAPSPFTSLWADVLDPVIEAQGPGRVLLSIAYLAQLPAAIDLARFLESRGITPVVGGSLPTSLALTGHGIDALKDVFPDIISGDGLDLIPHGQSERMLDRLSWPNILSDKPYLSARPIIPIALSSGCYWNRCLFCPDRTLGFARVPIDAVAGLLETIPDSLKEARPVVHLLDSALPPDALERFLALSRCHQIGFYGFARPTEKLLQNGLLEQAAQNGCLMLQLGAESGSKPLLNRYHKGIDPAETEQVLRTAAQAGIRTYLYLLFGLPGETEQDRKATLDLVVRNATEIDFLNLSLFNLPRYCALTERPTQFGIELSDFPGDRDCIRLYWPFSCNGSNPRDDARRFLKTTFNPHPLVHRAQLRTPRWLRAAHLALMKLPRRN